MKNLLLNLMILVNVLIILVSAIFIAFVFLMVTSIADAFGGSASSLLTSIF